METPQILHVCPNCGHSATYPHANHLNCHCCDTPMECPERVRAATQRQREASALTIARNTVAVLLRDVSGISDEQEDALHQLVEALNAAGK